MIDMRICLCSPSDSSRLSVLVRTAVSLLFILTALPAPTQCGEDNDPDWYSRSAQMIKAQPPEEIYTRGRGHAYLGIPYVPELFHSHLRPGPSFIVHIVQAMPSNGTNAFKLPQKINPYVNYTDVGRASGSCVIQCDLIRWA